MTTVPKAPKRILSKPHYVPIIPKDSGLRENPNSTTAKVTAFRSVLIHLLSTAFDLRDEEITWTGYRLDRALAPLLDKQSSVIPFPVRQEMLDGTYSRLVSLRKKKNRVPAAYDPKVLSATLEEWAEAILAPIFASYELRPLDEINMRSEIVTLLKNLGVGDPVNPRMATYLPSDLRQRIFADRSISQK